MKKNASAVALGKRRWKGKTKAQRRAHMKMMADKATAKRQSHPPEETREKPLDT